MNGNLHTGKPLRNPVYEGCAQQIAGKVHKTRCAKGRLVAAKLLGITLDRLAQYCLLVNTQFCIVRHFGRLMRGY